MSKGLPKVVGLASLLLVAACDHIPYYNESLDWFSWSRYDPEVNAIVAEIPPPGELEARPMSMKDGMMDDPPAATAPMAGASGAVNAPSVSGTSTVATSVGPTSTATSASASAGGSSSSAPLVGVRDSVGGSVTWRSTRGTP